MFAKINKIDCIPMTKYDYCKDIKQGTSYLEDKNIKGYYIPGLNTWITEDNFNEYFSIIDDQRSI